MDHLAKVANFNNAPPDEKNKLRAKLRLALSNRWFNLKDKLYKPKSWELHIDDSGLYTWLGFNKHNTYIVIDEDEELFMDFKSILLKQEPQLVVPNFLIGQLIKDTCVFDLRNLPRRPI